MMVERLKGASRGEASLAADRRKPGKGLLIARMLECLGQEQK